MKPTIVSLHYRQPRHHITLVNGPNLTTVRPAQGMKFRLRCRRRRPQRLCHYHHLPIPLPRQQWNVQLKNHAVIPIVTIKGNDHIPNYTRNTRKNDYYQTTSR
jgi:hypothetical protein